MVGGKVIDIVDTDEHVKLHVKDFPHSTSTQWIFLERTPAARSVSVGDGVWWLNDKVYWTPKGKPFGDYELKRK